ncbi:uncharacterized protein LOC128244587 [Mya arenaria]|uniref:uncharacterized protein LOC128244587 n=1 Tax=Mya arenaria TaxID=6604 RepID=UPI0022E968BA|nr:uncharacterized protein LOC128244587 [Mya arenaria]
MATAVTPKSVDETTQNEQHYLRLHLLVMKAGDVLRAKFDSIVHPNNLLNELRNYKRAIDKLQKDGIISKHQHCLLNSNPDSKKFDVSLLIVLLRHICNLHPKHPIWKESDNNKIFNNMHPDIANIVRIRNLRNKMQHKYVAYLDKKEFDGNWSLLENSMVIFGQSCGLNNVKADIDVLVKKNLGLVPPEMKSLREKTIWFFNEGCDEEFNEENYNDEYDEDGNHCNRRMDIDCIDDMDYFNENCVDDYYEENYNDEYDEDEYHDDNWMDIDGIDDMDYVNENCVDEYYVENYNDEYDEDEYHDDNWMDIDCIEDMDYFNENCVDEYYEENYYDKYDEDEYYYDNGLDIDCIEDMDYFNENCVDDYYEENYYDKYDEDEYYYNIWTESDCNEYEYGFHDSCCNEISMKCYFVLTDEDEIHSIKFDGDGNNDTVGFNEICDDKVYVENCHAGPNFDPIYNHETYTYFTNIGRKMDRALCVFRNFISVFYFRTNFLWTRIPCTDLRPFINGRCIRNIVYNGLAYVCAM